MKKQTDWRLGLALFIGMILLVISIWVINAYCWQYTLNTWIVFVGKEAVIKLWHGMLLSIVPGLGQTAIPAAIITYILMLIL